MPIPTPWRQPLYLNDVAILKQYGDDLFKMQPVTDNTVHLMFKRLKQRSDIPRLRAHLLRHTFATRYLENGGDIHTLQQILGHTSLEMVKRYVHTTTKHFVPSFSDYSPLDNLLAKTS